MSEAFKVLANGDIALNVWEILGLALGFGVLGWISALGSRTRGR